MSNLMPRSVHKDITRFSRKNNLHLEYLSQKLAYLAAIVESTSDAVISKDLNGIISSWNKGAEKLYGYKKEEVLGQPISKLFPADKAKEYEQIMSKIRQGKKIENHDTVRTRKDGKKVHISLSISPIKNMEGRVIGASVIARDISERIEQERRKDEFITVASHELKTPLTTLNGFVQILLQRSEMLSPKQQIYLSKMEEQLERLTELVNNLLDVSKLRSGKVLLNKEKFSLSEQVKEIVNDLQHIHNHELHFQTNFKGLVLADKYRIGQVLINLISNAVKYSPKANKVNIKIVKKGKAVEVSIRDFGIGIFEKDQKRIFERFYQAKNKIRGSFSGLGLGLFICAEIIKSHKGRIWVKSIKGQGSTFFFSLPLKNEKNTSL